MHNPLLKLVGCLFNLMNAVFPMGKCCRTQNSQDQGENQNPPPPTALLSWRLNLNYRFSLTSLPSPTNCQSDDKKKDFDHDSAHAPFGVFRKLGARPVFLVRSIVGCTYLRWQRGKHAIFIGMPFLSAENSPPLPTVVLLAK